MQIQVPRQSSGQAPPLLLINPQFFFLLALARASVSEEAEGSAEAESREEDERGASQIFAYDDFHRLVNAAGPYGEMTYAYNVWGNVVHKEGVDFTYGEGLPGLHRAASTSDGKSFTYDVRGNMLARAGGGKSYVYAWDEDGRLLSVSEGGVLKAEYDYDASGDRTRKIVYGAAGSVEAERFYFGDLFEVEARLSGATLTKHVFAGATRVATLHQEDSLLLAQNRINERGFAVMARQFNPGNPWGAARYAHAKIRSFSFSPMYRSLLAHFPAGLALAAFMGLCLLARRRVRETLNAERLTRKAKGALGDLSGLGVGRHACWVRATARAVMLALLLFMPLAYFAPPVEGEPLPVGTFYYHGDHLGSSALITDANGVVVETAFYKPFGEFHERTGNPSGKHYFTGQEKDDESELYYYGARYYDPEIARFISADSIVASPYDPQDLNRYAYTRNNPIIYVDPSGHGFFSSLKKWFPVIIAIAAAAVTAWWMASQTVVMGGLTFPMFSPLQIAMVSGAVGGQVGGAFGGGLKGALLGAPIGALSGGAGAWAGGAAGGGFAGALAGGAAGGAVGGALYAVVSGQNVFEGAIIGAATGAAFAAAMYGVGQAIRNNSANQRGELTIYGKKVRFKITQDLEIKVNPKDLEAISKFNPDIKNILSSPEVIAAFQEAGQSVITFQNNQPMDISKAKVIQKGGVIVEIDGTVSVANTWPGPETPAMAKDIPFELLPYKGPGRVLAYFNAHPQGYRIPLSDLTVAGQAKVPVFTIQHGDVFILVPGAMRAMPRIPLNKLPLKP